MKKIHLILISSFLLVFPDISAQFESFAASYGLLSTIAGKGTMDESGQVGWKAEYENGPAVEAELTRPHFAMADTAGNIYIADKDAHGIRKVTTDGIIMTIAGTNLPGFNGDGPGTDCQLNAPNGLYAMKDGTIYILDLGNDRIRRLDPQGNLVTIVDDNEGISLGRGLWVTEAEDSIFYASGTKIRLWTETNGTITYASGFGGLGNIAMDKNAFLVATDRSRDLVYRISKDGQETEVIAGTNGGSVGGDGFKATETVLDGVRGIWFLKDNSYFLATHTGSQVWYVDVNGWIHLFLDGRHGDEYHSGDGEDYRTPGYKISEARSVSVDHDGNVIIVENDLGYVRKVENKYDFFYSHDLLKETSPSEAFAYPNPAKDETFICFSNPQKERVSISVLSLTGAVVYRQAFEAEKGKNSFSINLQNLAEGIYFYQIHNQQRAITKKLILKR